MTIDLETSPVESPSPGLPAWAKILLGIFLTFVIVGVIALSCGIYGIATIQKDSTDPQKIAIAASKIAKFKQPLPDGYKLQSGITLGALGTQIEIVHPDSNDRFQFITLPGSKSSAKGTLDAHVAKRRGFVTKSQGTEQVGGEEMPYVIGDATNSNNVVTHELVGAIKPKGAEDDILLTVTSPQQLDMGIIQRLLASIEGFQVARNK